MPRYHFDLGDSNEGPVGFRAVVQAPTPERALEKLRDWLPESLPADEGGMGPTAHGEYLEVYFNADAIGLTDIDSEEEVGLPPDGHEPPEVEGWEHVRTWQHPEAVEEPEFRLELYDTHKPDGRHAMRTLLGYKFYHRGKLLFEGNSFGPSPTHCDDSDKTVGALLAWLSLKPGDTDADYFKDYTPGQLHFARAFGDELSQFARELEDER